MANQYKGEIKGKLGDKERTFRLTFENIVGIESRSGKSIMDISSSIASNTFSFKDILNVLHEGLMGAGGKYTVEAVGDMIMKTGVSSCAIITAQLVSTIFTGSDNIEEDSPLVQGENEQKSTQSSNT
jgi:hypothetical protein|tara:strand:- start:1043 stop:1423 length:381 start_codon:yes stop_codon:yes gene_type:complete